MHMLTIVKVSMCKAIACKSVERVELGIMEEVCKIITLRVRYGCFLGVSRIRGVPIWFFLHVPMSDIDSTKNTNN